MNLSLYIAKRYLFSPKSHQVINIISGVAIAGVTLATIAMVCTLSVFNGFKEMVAEQFTAFDPDLKISAAKGKTFTIEPVKYDELKNHPIIAAISLSLEDKAMVQYNGKQVMTTIKGVEESYGELTDISHSLVGNGKFILSDSINNYSVPGIGIVSSLNSGLYHVAPLEVYAPKRGGKVSLTNPAANFKKGFLHSSGASFITNQPKYDEGYIVTSVEFARELFGREYNEATSIEVKLTPEYNTNDAKKEIASLLGNDYKIEDRYEQQKDIFKVMRIEKFISYIFLSFILLIACFNIIGSLSMLIIEKKQNMETLRSLGASDKIIVNIFVLEGSIISAIGAVGGITLGIVICLLQQEYGLLALGDAGDGFVVSSYPVKVEIEDIITVFITVLIVGITAVWLPVKLLTKRFLARE